MRSLPNLVKQRYVVENKEQARVIDSNEKMMRLIGQTGEEGFTPGRFAQHVDVVTQEGESQDGLSGLEALLADSDRAEGEEALSAETMAEQDETKSAQQMKELADDILQQARSQAEELLSDARMNAEQEAETIKQQAYEQGILQAQEELQTIRQQQTEEHQAILQQQNTEYQQQLEQMEPMLVDTILSVMQEVLHVEVEDYRPIILDLVMQTMMQADNPKEFSIYANEENSTFIKENIDHLRTIAGEETKLEILINHQMSEQECRIETEFGIYDCGFDVQLKNLSNRIRLLSKQKE